MLWPAVDTQVQLVAVMELNKEVRKPVPTSRVAEAAVAAAVRALVAVIAAATVPAPAGVAAEDIRNAAAVAAAAAACGMYAAEISTAAAAAVVRVATRGLGDGSIPCSHRRHYLRAGFLQWSQLTNCVQPGCFGTELLPWVSCAPYFQPPIGSANVRGVAL